MMTQSQFPLFAETPIRQLYTERSDKIEETISDEDENTILNTNKTDYLGWLLEKYKIRKPVLNRDGQGLLREQRTDGRMQKEELVLCYPVSGNTDIFRYAPTTRRSNKYPTKVEDGLLKIDLGIQTRRKTNAQSKIDRARKYLDTHLENLEEDIEEMNENLENTAERRFDNRRRDIEREYDELDSLDVPVLDRDDVSETFAALEIDEHEKIHVEKPDPLETAEPGVDPTVPEEDYRKIVSAINDVGKNFEKNPSLFEDRPEEDLRDFILFYLQPRFKGTASGETFNVEGKSDIMLQYDGHPIFIAECAIWDGPQYYLDKITQLHQYLRWRDSKAAVILFVQDTAMETVQQSIREQTTDHETVDKLVEKIDETWYEFQAHVDGDEDREVTLSVLTFNIPAP